MEVLARLGVGLARGACACLSPLSIDALRRLGAVAGDALLRVDGRPARTTRINVDLVYADRDAAWRRNLVAESLRQTAMTVVEAVALWTWPLPRLHGLLREAAGESLLRDRPPGRGALLLVPHFGNWEYLGCYLNTVATLLPLYARPASPAVDAALSRARVRLGHRPAPDSVAGLRMLVRGLRSGRMAAVLPDQVPAVGSGVTAPFLGHPASTMTLVSKLLRRVDADVLCAFAMRVPGGFSVHVEPVDEAVRDADPAVAARAVNAAVEAVVARDPAQYQWEYKRYRFRRQPNIYR